MEDYKEKLLNLNETSVSPAGCPDLSGLCEGSDMTSASYEPDVKESYLPNYEPSVAEEREEGKRWGPGCRALTCITFLFLQEHW